MWSMVITFIVYGILLAFTIFGFFYGIGIVVNFIHRFL